MNGILAVHISNRYLDLAPVIAAYSTQTDKVAVSVKSRADPATACLSSDWVLITGHSPKASELEFLALGTPLEPRPGFRLWTDDFSNLFSVLK